MNLGDVADHAFGRGGWLWAYTALVSLWALVFFLSVRPSARVYESAIPDWNIARPALQFLAAVILPWLIFSVLADYNLLSPLAWIYPAVAFFFFLSGRSFTRVLTNYGPDARAGDDFHFWVRILTEGETQHLFRSWGRSRRLMLLAAVCSVALFAIFVTAAWQAASLAVASRANHTHNYANVAGALFSTVAILAFVVTWIISRLALGMQSVSFPVRYGVAANSLQVFLLATWAAIYPWFVFGAADTTQMYQFSAAVFVLYLLLVLWPMVVWRSDFRQVRAVRLREFKRIVHRIEVAARPKPADLEPAGYATFQTTAMRKAYTALERTFKKLVGGSPFRAFTMIYINAAPEQNRHQLPPESIAWPWYIKAWRFIVNRRPRPAAHEHRDDVLCAHMLVARETLESLGQAAAADAMIKRHAPPRKFEDMDGYQQLVHTWIKDECEACKKRYVGEDQRVISALEIANPQLKKMVTEYRYGIEQTDYRYRLMYWCARLLSRMRNDDGAFAVANASYLLPLTHEILADLDALERRWDAKSLALYVGGVIATGAFSLVLAVGQGAAQALMESWARH